MASKAWNEIIYPSLDFNGTAVEVWERISNFIPHFTGRVIIYYVSFKISPCWLKGAQGEEAIFSVAQDFSNEIMWISTKCLFNFTIRGLSYGFSAMV